MVLVELDIPSITTCKNEIDILISVDYFISLHLMEDSSVDSDRLS